LHLDTWCFGNLSAAVVDDIFAKILPQISPTTTDTYHDTLILLSNSTNEQFCGSCLSGVLEVIEPDTAIFRFEYL
jgi:hypothetical protein